MEAFYPGENHGIFVSLLHPSLEGNSLVFTGPCHDMLLRHRPKSNEPKPTNTSRSVNENPHFLLYILLI